MQSRSERPFRPIEVTADECDGSFEKMLRRFVRKTKEDGILAEVFDRRGFVKPCQVRRRVKRAQR